MTTANELRRMFLDFYVERGHALVASSPIVPPDDPTMLFTSAGMVQFKPLYAGIVDPLPYKRATTCQKCLRAGGKASDLENVGKTLRHHTFFEMLGNFSFGDYFKKEALEWGWDFIWNHMKLPKERLWATTYEEDDEAPKMLEALGIPRNRIIPLNAKENFWGPAGDTGACGPCSEICFFMGTDAELQEAMKQSPEEIARRIVEEGDLFLEIWNMVFPQFNQQLDGSRPLLKNRGIDTGAGLERMTTVLQFMETGGKIRTPYETDLLSPIIAAASQAVRMPYYKIAETPADYDVTKRFAINAIADHTRALTFAISEGIVPSNEGRGYVLRRILRRALRYGYLLGMDSPFMYKVVDSVVQAMGGAYPEIAQQPAHVALVIRNEEERFMRTVAQGSRILDEMVAKAKAEKASVISGEDAFLLYATYGFPVDMTAEIAEDNGLELDRAGYQAAMKRHQQEARKSWKGAALGDEAELLGDIYEQYGESDFKGYESTEIESRVLAIVKGSARAQSVGAGDEATIILEETSFYAESGGQVGDEGSLESPEGFFHVSDTQKTPSGILMHRGMVKKGTIKVGNILSAKVDLERRLAIMRNHTVTHVLQAALKQVVGRHITQAGSYVGPQGMRFDFNHMQACTSDQLQQVERIVNENILRDYVVQVDVLPIEKARQRGAIAPFGEKYGHIVRVVRIGDISMEFCGGTHLDRTGRIGSFRLTAESSVAAGIRRIEGVTGLGAYDRWAATRDVVSDLSRSLATKEEGLIERVSVMQDEIKKLGREIRRLKESRSSASVDDLAALAVVVNGVKVITARIDDAEPEQLRTVADQLRDKIPSLVCVLGSVAEGKVSLLCLVAKELTKRVQAGNVIKQIAPIVGGGGGGRPELAQAGGKNPEKLDEAIGTALGVIRGMLG